MVYASLNPSKVAAVLTDPSVSSGLFGDDEPYFPKNALFLFSDGLLFVVQAAGNRISIHPAIPENQRGKKAVKACKNLINWAKSLGFRAMCQIDKNKRSKKMFAAMCGMKKIGSSDKWDYYEAL